MKINIRRSYLTKSYLTKIMLLIMLCIGMILAPFSYMTYNLAKNNMIQSIDQSNNKVLEHAKQTFNYFQENIVSMSLGIFYDPNIRSILYNKDVDEYKALNTLKNMQETILIANPSIHSVYIYNENEDRMYTPQTRQAFNDIELLKFVQDNKQLPPAKPILRKIPMSSENKENYIYVFSYFMYEYVDTDKNISSFIVVNQKADWFINTISNSIASNNPQTRKSDVVLVGNKGEIFYKSINQNLNEVYEELGSRFIDHKEQDNKDAGFYIEEIAGKKYLISWIDLQTGQNSLVMMQNYEEVFYNLLELNKGFIFIILLFVAIASILLILVSNKIYSPIQKLIKDIDYTDKIDKQEKNKDEFEYLRNVYSHYNTLNNGFRKTQSSNKHIIQQYYLENILLNSSTDMINQFRLMQSNHWVFRQEGLNLCVVYFKLDYYNEIQENNSLKDIALIEYATQNIVEELLAKDFEVETIAKQFSGLTLLIGSKLQRTLLEDKLKTHLRSTQKYLRNYFDISISVAISNVSEQLEELTKLYNQTQEYMQYTFTYGTSLIIDEKTCKINLENSNTTYSTHLKNKLIEAIKINNIEQIKSTLKEIGQQMSTLSYPNLFTCIMQLLNNIQITIMEQQKKNTDTIHINFMNLYKVAIESEYLEDTLNAIQGFLEDQITPTNGIVKNKEQVLVETIISYIEKNCGDINLCIQQIADALGVSNKHISKIFKECTNMSLNEYIVTIRMKKAAHILRESTLPIHEVALKVGMENESYFYKLFKKHYGCTPREYAVNSKLINMENNIRK